jgi:hypothetical protein
MRKGIYIVEMLVVTLVLVLVGATLSGLFRTIAFELPRNSRLLAENTRLLGALECMRGDVSSASGLTSGNKKGMDAAGLYIERPEGITCYEFKDGELIRSSPDNGGDEMGCEPMVWSVPHGRIAWRVLERGGKGYAVEVRACLVLQEGGRSFEKMSNSYVFFVGAGKEAEQ